MGTNKESFQIPCRTFGPIQNIHKTCESESEVAQSCLTLWDPMDCILSGSSIHGIFQARVLECIAISFSRGSSRPRNRTWVPCIAGIHFTVWATREAQMEHQKGAPGWHVVHMKRPLESGPIIFGSCQMDRTKYQGPLGMYYMSYEHFGQHQV